MFNNTKIFCTQYCALKEMAKWGGTFFFITALKTNFLVGYKKQSCMLQQKNPGFELQPDISVRPRF